MKQNHYNVDMNKHLVNIHKALGFVADELEKQKANWFLGASGALMVWGVDVIPNDLDIIVPTSDLEKLEKVFKSRGINRLETGDTDCKYLKFKIEIFNIQAEIIGMDVFDGEHLQVDFQGRKIPVNPLEKELEFYQKRSKGKEKIDLIKKRIEELRNINLT